MKQRFSIIHWVSTKIFTLKGDSCWSFQYMTNAPPLSEEKTCEDRFATYDRANKIDAVMNYPLPVVQESSPRAARGYVCILRPSYKFFRLRDKPLDGWSYDNCYAGYIWAKANHYPVVSPVFSPCEDCGWHCEQQCFKLDPVCFWKNFNKV